MSHLRQVRNYKRIVAPITYMLSSEDDVIDVDTTLGLATIYIPNIQADATIDRKFYINDATNNAGINPITIVTIGGNTINNVTSLPLSVNGISAEILIVDRNRYLANLNSDDSSGGTLTGANNGLNVVLSTVKLGGALITPTVITASVANHLDVQDSFGSFFKTRDANANFSIADFGGNVVAPTATNIFSYLAIGNNYDATTNIVVNFGSVGNYLNAVDTWNFGDYNYFENSNVSFNLGRLNSYTFTNSASIFGNFNNVYDGISTKIIGDSNVISSGSGSAYVFGYSNTINGSGSFIVGRNNSVDDNIGDIYAMGWGLSIVGGSGVDAIVSLGFVNTIFNTSSTRGVYMLGDSHVCNDFVTYSTLIGESCNFTRVDHCTSLGIFTTLTDTTNVYTYGEGNTIENSTTITNFGTYNYISDSTNLGVFGNNNIITDDDKLYIGNNNNNMVVDGITGYVGIGTTNPIYALHVQTLTDQYGILHTDGTIKLATYVGLGGGVPSGQIGMESPDSLYIYGYRGGVYDTFIKYEESATNKNWGLNTYFPTANWHVTGQSSTVSDYAFKVDNFSGSPLLYARNDGLISMPNLQVGNAGLVSGDLYVDTSANVLANGDLVLARKV